jgi:hypothetical protein
MSDTEIKDENKANGTPLVIYPTKVKPSSFDGLTFSKYLHYIKVYKYWVAGVAILCALASFLGSRYGVNRSRETLETSFTYTLPMQGKNILTEATTDSDATYSRFITSKATAGKITDQTTFTYLNGEAYDYKNLITAKNLHLVKDNVKDENGNLKYKDIDVDKIAIGKDITITANTTTNSLGNTVLIPFSYTIDAKASFFKNQYLGKLFLQDLVATINSRCANNLTGYSVSSGLSSSFGTDDFDADIQALNTVYGEIYDAYDGIAYAFDTSLLVDGKSIAQYQREFVTKYTYLDTNVFEKLDRQEASNFYVRFADDTEMQDKLAKYKALGEGDKNRLLTLNDRYNQYSSLLSTIASGYSSGNTALAEEYLTVSKLVRDTMAVRLDVVRELRILGYEVSADYSSATLYSGTDTSKWGKIQHLENPSEGGWKDGCTAFSKEITDEKTNIIASLAECNRVFVIAYGSQDNSVSYNTTGAVALTNHVSDLALTLAGLVFGFAVVSIIGAAVGNYRDNKKKHETKDEVAPETK